MYDGNAQHDRRSFLEDMVRYTGRTLAATGALDVAGNLIDRFFQRTSGAYAETPTERARRRAGEADLDFKEELYRN